MNVVVADDSRVMRQIVVRTLRQAGYDDWDITEAENGKEAYDLAMANDPDLILSDWNMPEMTGIEMLQALNAAGSEIPVGFVTSEGSQQMRDMADAEGALFLIAKPFDATTFKSTIDPFLA